MYCISILRDVIPFIQQKRSSVRCSLFCLLSESTPSIPVVQGNPIGVLAQAQIDEMLVKLSLLLPDVMRILLDVVRPEVDEGTLTMLRCNVRLPFDEWLHVDLCGSAHTQSDECL